MMEKPPSCPGSNQTSDWIKKMAICVNKPKYHPHCTGGKTWLAPVMAVHALTLEDSRCQPEFLRSWGTFNAVGATTAEDMDVKSTPVQTHVRQSQALCAGEQEYIHQRKQVVLESLNSLGINCTADGVPHIALLASGGGQRAAVGLVGSLHQMQKDGLLDAMLYLGGVSGGTWSMASLYSDPEWSVQMDRAVSMLFGTRVHLAEALAWLSQTAQEDNFSLTDIWGVMTAAGIMKRLDLRRLSSEASRNATNPYPIYCAMEKYCFANGPIQGKWVEVSPHEAGFTELGLFVETSLLGSKFHNGTMVEKKTEMDMVRLQGVLGCALADEEIAQEYIPPWLYGPGYMDSGAEKYLCAYMVLDKFLSLTRGTIIDDAAQADLDHLQKILQDKVNHNASASLESKTPEERKQLFVDWTMELLNAVEVWSQHLQDGPFKTHISVLTGRIIPLIVNWEWGTTENFLYQYEGSVIPPCLYSSETFHLMDAGLLINVAYPSFLGDKRDIDLIIAPEYSAGDMFETLTLARDYAAEVKKPFPEIDTAILEEKDWPKECYVFEGKDKEPTIVFMPLFNRRNCKDAQEYKARMDEYATFGHPFSPDKIEFVLETAKVNMKNNKEVLLREMNKAALRRQNKSQA